MSRPTSLPPATDTDPPSRLTDWLPARLASANWQPAADESVPLASPPLTLATSQACQLLGLPPSLIPTVTARLFAWCQAHIQVLLRRGAPFDWLWPTTILMWALERAGIAELRTTDLLLMMHLIHEAGFSAEANRSGPVRRWQVGHRAMAPGVAIPGHRAREERNIGSALWQLPPACLGVFAQAVLLEAARPPAAGPGGSPVPAACL